MKQINLEHLNLRLPADSNFIEFANYAANSNIIALCKALFPSNKAVVLYGVELTRGTTTSYTAGAIYYNGEIYFVDTFTYGNSTIKSPSQGAGASSQGVGTSSQGAGTSSPPDFAALPSNPPVQQDSGIKFCIRETVTEVMYMMSDVELPAYMERKIYPIQPGETDPVVDALKWNNLIRLSNLNRTIVINSSDQIGTVQLSPNVKHLLMNIDIMFTQADFKAARIPLTGVSIPNQYLGLATLSKMRIIPGEGTPIGIYGEKRYKLFMFNGYLCLAHPMVVNLNNFNECITYEEIRYHFDNMAPNIPYRIEFNHQTIAQL